MANILHLFCCGVNVFTYCYLCCMLFATKWMHIFRNFSTSRKLHASSSDKTIACDWWMHVLGFWWIKAICKFYHCNERATHKPVGVCCVQYAESAHNLGTVPKNQSTPSWFRWLALFFYHYETFTSVINAQFCWLFRIYFSVTKFCVNYFVNHEQINKRKRVKLFAWNWKLTFTKVRGKHK